MGNGMKEFRARMAVLVGICMLAVFVLPCTVCAAEYTYDGTPSFTVTYPSTLTKDVADKEPFVVKRVQNPSGTPTLDIGIGDIPNGLKLEDTGKDYDRQLKESSASDTTVLSDKMIKLADGTDANLVVINWLWDGWFKIQTVALSVYKNDKWICIAWHDSQKPLDKVNMDVVMSLKLK